MLTNLFSIFDPATTMNTAMNWAAMATSLLLLPTLFWKTKGRLLIPFNSLMSYLFSEFKPLLNKSPSALLIMLGLFVFIMLNNVFGLMPYIFTCTSHMSISMMMALPMWLGMMAHGWTFNTSNLLIHLVPKGTPMALMPFMVIIETISNIIRPLTLAIRLAANMIAGHLLITLLTSVTPFTPLSALPVLMSAQLSLNLLETAVAFIQAYVFSVLITLYASESIS
uniref:ATP synthase subunit a n=1 Tax=Grandidierella japonica TaxID=429032 RepID=A0A5H2XWM4_GRAJA|nr:ATP synthase F0 subunit 6 [Grandidierella japonica]